MNSSGDIPTRKSNEAILDERMTSAGCTYVGTEVQDDGSSSVTYQTREGKYVRVHVRSDVIAQITEED